MSPPLAENGASDVAALCKQVRYLSEVDDETLVEIAARGRRLRFRSGERIVSELESGADVFVLLQGEAEVSVDARAGERQVFGRLAAGSAFGEMSSLTGELRSATVTALDDVEVLILPDAEFDRLRERRPRIACALVRVLADRLAEAERSIDEMFTADVALPSTVPASLGPRLRRGSVAAIWRALVVERRRDLAFGALAAFVITLVSIRLLVFASFELDFAPREVLRGAYVTGFALVAVSACVALLSYRPSWRRAIALCYGVGCALIFNELGVTLAFDIFYKDIHTPDPSVPFDIELLYRRTEPIRATVIALLVLIQAAYLRRFYRRVAFLFATRARRWLSTAPLLSRFRL